MSKNFFYMAWYTYLCMYTDLGTKCEIYYFSEHWFKCVHLYIIDSILRPIGALCSRDGVPKYVIRALLDNAQARKVETANQMSIGLELPNTIFLLPQQSTTRIYLTGCPGYFSPFSKGYNFIKNWLRTKILVGECQSWAAILFDVWLEICDIQRIEC